MKKRLSHMEKIMIEKRAEKILEVYKACRSKASRQTVYVDAVQMARCFGFVVEENPRLPENEDGSISVSADGKEKIITLNDARSREFKRFVIAHELAHYLLHYTGEGAFFKHRETAKGRNAEENDADYLAVCLLMPAPVFRKQYAALKKEKDYVQVVSSLQDMFKMPRESIERRIREVS